MSALIFIFDEEDYENVTDHHWFLLNCLSLDENRD